MVSHQAGYPDYNNTLFLFVSRSLNNHQTTSYWNMDDLNSCLLLVSEKRNFRRWETSHHSLYRQHSSIRRFVHMVQILPINASAYLYVVGGGKFGNLHHVLLALFTRAVWISPKVTTTPSCLSHRTFNLTTMTPIHSATTLWTFSVLLSFVRDTVTVAMSFNLLTVTWIFVQ